MGKRGGWPWSRREENREEERRRELEESLAETRVLIAQAYAGFNAADDGELVESYIYEIQALRTRYSYLLRARKGLESPGEGAEGDPQTGRTALPVA